MSFQTPIELEYKTLAERERLLLFLFTLPGASTVKLWAPTTKAAIQRFNREFQGTLFGEVKLA